MGPFSLAVPAHRLRPAHSQRKRKRQEGEDQQDPPSPLPESPDPSSHLPSDSINPRSHSPQTLRQFAVAGLSPAEEVPSKLHPSFPHRPLPPDYPNSKESGRHRKKGRMASSAAGSSRTETDDGDTTDASDARVRGRLALDYSTRMKHLNTMTTIMHRCFHSGDIKRAKRAFGLLIRTREVDIRVNDMWNIGTEILMRDGEGEKRGEAAGKARENANGEAPNPRPSNHEGEEGSKPLQPRWGAAENVDKARAYLESLILQHPYDKHRTQYPSAIDFWPTLFSIEIYNIDAEFKRALQKLDKEVDAESPSSSPPPEGEDDELSDRGAGGGDDYHERQMRRREERKKTAQRAAKDEIRQITQEAAQQIADRMDKQMENAPYTTHLELLRLRGMLALFIGDLYLPSRIMERQGLEAQMEGLSLYGRNLKRETEDQREHEVVERREAELEKARAYFRRIQENKGQLAPWLERFLDAGDEGSVDEE